MQQDVVARKASIQPIRLLQESQQLLGEQYWLFVGITFVGVLIGSAVPMAILLGPMMCGIYLCYMQRSTGKPVEFSLLFKGFDYFVESLIATLIITGVTLIVLVPAYLIFGVAMLALIAGGEGDPGPTMFVVLPVLYAVVFALIVLVSLPFVFVFPLIVDRGLKAIPAIKASF